VRTVTKTRRVPTISYKAVQEEYTEYEYDTVTRQHEVEEDVRSMVNVPASILTAVEIEEPKEIQKEIIEQIAVVKSMDFQIKVPITIVERLPQPPCHWHEMRHSHGVVDG